MYEGQSQARHLEGTELRNTRKAASIDFHYSSVIYVCELSAFGSSCFSFWNSFPPLFIPVIIQEKGTSFLLTECFFWFPNKFLRIVSDYRTPAHGDPSPDIPFLPSWAQLFTGSLRSHCTLTFHSFSFKV